MISVNDLKKTDLRNNKPLSSNTTVDYFDDLDCFNDFENEFPAIVFNDGLTSKSNLEIKPLISTECIDETDLINKTSFSEYDEEIISRFNDLLNDIRPDDLKSERDDDDNNNGIMQSSEEQEMAEDGFGAYWIGSNRLIPDKGVLGIIGRKSRARLSGGHFIGRLAMHFGLVSEEGLRGFQVVTQKLPLIDLHELGRLYICTRYDDTWAWAAQGLQRQQVAVAGTHEADEARPVAKKVDVDIRAPAQAPLPPPPAPQPHTMSQRIERVEEEIIQTFYHGLDDPTQGILEARGIFLYNTPNEAFKILEDKYKNDAEFITIRGELKEMRDNCRNDKEYHASYYYMSDDTMMCDLMEANYVQGYHDQNSRNSYSYSFTNHDYLQYYSPPSKYFKIPKTSMEEMMEEMASLIEANERMKDQVVKLERQSIKD
uniref:Uncharacterized protein n=1 Tax=Tanacetum cinerariifolium TaxID=118510 RepID=A0A699HBI6_TANCI|nr:hypothetical protein [Tanacetum cinerariifolium]